MILKQHHAIEHDDIDEQITFQSATDLDMSSENGNRYAIQINAIHVYDVIPEHATQIAREYLDSLTSEQLVSGEY